MFRVRRHARHPYQVRRGQFLAISAIGGVAIAISSLCAAHWEAGPAISENKLRAIPLNAIGIVAHYVAKTPIPPRVRSTFYKAYCSAIGCDVSECGNLRQFRSLAEFFARSHNPESRPLDNTAALIVPCDGKVIAAGPVGPYGSIEVKGIRYQVRDLVGAADQEPLSLSSVAVGERVESGSRLWFAALHIRPGDCHRFSSPAVWTLDQTRHFSGYLLWMRPTIEGLYTQNERLAFLGDWVHGFFSLTAVGAAGRGSIRLDFGEQIEERFTPNLRSKLEDVTTRRYPGGQNLTLGQAIGGFLLGSAVIVVFEAPENGFRFKVKQGDVVKVGQELATVCSIEDSVLHPKPSDVSKATHPTEARARFRRAW